MNFENIVRDADKYYTSKFLEKSDGPEAADWNSIDAQHIRFKQLTHILPEDHQEIFSICDFGCGLGDLKCYLEPIYSEMEYTGIDISSKIIEKAQGVHSGGDIYMQ